MREIRIICDICGKELTENSAYKTILPCNGEIVVKNAYGNIVSHYQTNDICLDNKDLCKDCATDLVDYIEEKRRVKT